LDLELRGKKVLITGASKGLGLACAQGFASEGAIVHLAARNESALKSAAESIRKQYKTEVFIHAVDLSKTENVIALGKTCADVDILVNNAGAIPGGDLLDITDERWRQAWDLKVFSFINLTRELYKAMRERKSGVIVNIIGVAGERHRANYITGTTGNAGLMAFTRALGSESVDHGIRVVGINPGRIETERQVGHFKEEALKAFGDESRWPELQAKVVVSLPFGRAGRPSEVSDLATFLASNRASYISGTVVTIDAGSSLRPRV
jgi:NAD(P)-dependent dehydrogenase (short-subunit alcohol dehydrogenase family)